MKTRKIDWLTIWPYGAGRFSRRRHDGANRRMAALLLHDLCGLTPIEATLIFAAARVGWTRW